ncbi:MAG TPA: 2OG-Fe(II) oxygenase family protein [Alphaproteobacteria bacterium]
MIQNSGTQQIFATPVWIVDLTADYAAALNGRLIKEIEALTGALPPLAAGRTNWQTETNLHRLPQFAEVVQLFEQSGRAAADYLKLKSRDFVVTGCWANVNPPGGHNPSHSHPNNYLSGVYYVSIPDGEGRIAFEDPRIQAQVMMPPVTELTPYNGNIVTFEVKPGRLLVFPAWLGHSVPSNRSQHNRISMSFNLMFRNYAEELSQPLWKGAVGG